MSALRLVCALVRFHSFLCSDERNAAISYLSWSGHCLIQTSKSDFKGEELLAIVNEGVNALLYSPWFSKLLSTARNNPAVLSALKAMGQINCTGAALNPEDEIWATEQGIAVTVNELRFN
jgi:hypothetical protein